MNLRDALLDALSTLPGSRDFHIHVLASSPRKHSGLYPYATPRPRVYLQDILVLLSEQAPGSSRVLVTAVEANVYNIPATSCGILYISKVDGTAQGIAPSPTATLVKALMRYFVNPETRPIHVDTLWVQLFARAQGQYLFPNSADFPEKKPLSDVKLCSWWRKVFTDVAESLSSNGSMEAKGPTAAEAGGEAQAEGLRKTSDKVTSKLYYVLPGYNELEAIQSLKLPLNLSATNTNAGPSSRAQWTYGHPYTQTEIPLPCPPNPKGHTGLGHFIPSFDDDPKNRFMDEIALTTDSNGIKSPKKKKPKTTLRKPDSKANGVSRPREEEADADGKLKGKDKSEEKDTGEEEGENGEGPRASGELDKVTPDEFWERMSFRQECIAGAVTGFFALGVTYTSSSRDAALSGPSPLAPQPGQVAPRLVRRVVASLMNGHEFSTTERCVRATQVLEDAIKGLCENIASVPATSKPNVTSSSTAHLLFLRDADGDDDKEAQAAGSVNPTNGGNGNDENTSDNAITVTRNPEEDSYEELPPLPRTPPPRRAHLPEISPNPFPEPVTSLETYHSHIYGTVAVTNPALPPKSSVGAAEAEGKEKKVTVLTVRKKKRKTDT